MNYRNFKTLILLATIVMFGFNSMAQEESDCIKIRGSETKPYFAISVEMFNILYAGIPNPVVVASSFPPKKLRISWGGATATHYINEQYDVIVPDSLAGRIITITVSAEIKRGKTKILGNSSFRIKPLPDPIMYVGATIREGYQSVYKDVILANPLVVARMGTDFNLELRWQILSYNVTFVTNCIEEPPITIKGHQFSEEVINKIINAPSGTIIEFSDFEISSIAGYRTIQKQIVIRIK